MARWEARFPRYGNVLRTVSRRAALVALALPASAGLAAGRGGAGDAPAEEPGLTFHEHVLPLVRRRCIGCHGGERPKGRYRMDSYDAFVAGGRRGTAVVPGKPGESLLYLLVSGRKKPTMPPKKADPVAPEEVEVLRRWIEAGAREGEARAAAPYSGPRSPPVYHHPPVISSLGFPPDGRRILVAAYREVVVHSWPPSGGSETPEALARLVGEAERINDMAVDPSGRLLAAAGGSPGRFGEIQLWDLETERLLRFRRFSDDTLFAVDFSPDGGQVAAGGGDRAVHFFDTDDLEPAASAVIHSDWILELAWSPDGENVLSGSRDGTVKVTRADGTYLKTLVQCRRAVATLAARPRAREVLVGADVPVLYSTADLEERRKIEAAPGEVLAAAFRHDGRLFALAGSSREIRLHASASGERWATFESPSPWIYALAFEPDGRRLAAAGYDGRVHVYDLREKKRAGSFLPVPLVAPP